MSVVPPLAAFLDDPNWGVAKNGGILLLVILWLATAFWTFKDARRRIEDTWLIGLATLIGLFPPFLGPIIYLFFRPPEYLQDVRERDLEIKAMEERLAQLDQRCPVCRARVEPSYLVCPVCTTRLKQSCASCDQPLEALWQVCPYCAAVVPPVLPVLEDFSAEALRATRRRKPTS